MTGSFSEIILDAQEILVRESDIKADLESGWISRDLQKGIVDSIQTLVRCYYLLDDALAAANGFE